jgi:D-alanine-D-alanine ligase
MVELGLERPMEIEVSVLGNEFPIASVPGEIVPGDEFYTYEDKYINGLSQLIIPAELPDGIVDKIQQTALHAYTAIDCAGMARVDFMFNQNDGTLYVNELNTIPGFTTISMYAKLWEASGISYKQLITKLIELAVDRQHERTRSLYQYQGKQL